MKRYDIVEFKREGPVSAVLGKVLKMFAPRWDGWGWHLAIAWVRVYDGWMMLESIAGGVMLKFHSDTELAQNTRWYSWLSSVDDKEAANFRLDHIGKKYDVAVYFWSALQYLVRHFFNRRIPRLLDDKYTCWELVAEFCRDMGKPIQSRYDCPMLPDILDNISASVSRTAPTAVAIVRRKGS